MMRTVELEACTIELLDDDIVHVHFKDHRLVTEEDVQAMFEALEEQREGRKVLLLVSVGEGTSMNNEARALASSDRSSEFIAADAIVVRDFGHHLAANVFVRHHKPGRPIQMFPDQASALQWLKQQRHLIDQDQ